MHFCTYREVYVSSVPYSRRAVNDLRNFHPLETRVKGLADQCFDGRSQRAGKGQKRLAGCSAKILRSLLVMLKRPDAHARALRKFRLRKSRMLAKDLETRLRIRRGIERVQSA